MGGRHDEAQDGQRALIVDAGPLFAAFDTADPWHAECRDLLESHEGPLLVPSLALAEAAYMIGARIGAEAEVMLAADLADGNLFCEEVSAADWERIAELAARYHDMPLGMADASLIAAAERLGITEVATLDRRLAAVRPAHVEAFTLLP